MSVSPYSLNSKVFKKFREKHFEQTVLFLCIYFLCLSLPCLPPLHPTVNHTYNTYLTCSLPISSVHDTKICILLFQVFIGECVSARVSYMELNFDDMKTVKQKCSGFIASTGRLCKHRWHRFYTASSAICTDMCVQSISFELTVIL